MVETDALRAKAVWFDKYGPGYSGLANTLRQAADTIDTLHHQLAEARARVEKLELAGWCVFDNRQSTFTARNGRKVGIQDDSGEKCWIVPFDDMADLEHALASEAPTHD